MLGWFSEARILASRWNRASRSASCANASGRILIATSRSSFVSRARIHLPHAAYADAGDNFVDTETCTGSKRQG